ncbi:MAG: glycerol dehydrogenase [Alphaproteobacteria bacterium]|nr:glycerol dehydrogenase [Alphaproteobacteria bacterium]
MTPLAILGSPQRYMQGPGALDRLGEVAREHGAKPFVVADAAVEKLLGTRIGATLSAAGCACATGRFSGEITRPEVERLAQECRAAGCDAVIAVGGGKTIDAAKFVKLTLGLPIVVVPSVASNDAPTSRVIVIYDAHHAIAEILMLPSNPETVLVDTAVIARAPARFFAAGIGDALSKKFEAEQGARGGALNLFKGRPTATAVAMGAMCYDAIRRHGLAAMEAVKRQEVTEDLERTVEATILLSGLSFESGGLSAAHAMTRGLTTCAGTRDALHGEMVSFGLMVQLVLEGRDAAFLADLRRFCRALGLPVSLAGLGLAHPTDADYRLLAERSMTAAYIRFMTVPVDADRLEAAIRRADALGRQAA